MNIADLPFDADEMLAGLRPWVECESPTFDRFAVNRMMDLASRDLAMMGAAVERIPGRMGLGDVVRARFPHPKADQPGIVIAGHMDTVHPIGTLEKLAFRREGALCYGPGICDMKGGNYLALEAIRQLARAGMETPLPITVLFTPDEEIGTPSQRDLIEAEASRARAVLVPEPGRPKGGVTSGRYAIARFNIRTIGKPSHSGAKLSEGRSAIAEMARRVLEIEAMTGPDCTFSCGVFHAGQWVNCVASEAEAEVLTMAKRQEDLDAGVQRMLAMAEDGVFQVTRGVTRPVWEPDAGCMELVTLAERFHSEIGMPFRHESSGGGSDGNFTGAMGVPTLDGLGVEGDKFHTLEEHIVVDSLARRGKVFAGMLMGIS